MCVPVWLDADQHAVVPEHGDQWLSDEREHPPAEGQVGRRTVRAPCIELVQRPLNLIQPIRLPPLSSTLSNYAAYASAFAARCHNWRGIFKLSRLARDTKET